MRTELLHATAILMAMALSGAAQQAISPRKKPGGRAPVAAERNAKLARLAAEDGQVREAALSSPLPFVGITPCRLLDTRTGGGLSGSFGPPTPTAGSTRTIPVRQSACNIPATATAYSLNITVVPPGVLGYITVFPTGSTRPLVSTLNALDGAVVANAAIVPAGTNGSVDLYVTDRTDVIVDINGYFGTGGSPQYFHSITPCRMMDTRGGAGLTGVFGSPAMAANEVRVLPVSSSRCSGIPSNATAYSLNATVLPREPLGFLSLYPAGTTRPNVSVLNSFTGRIESNAAIVPAGSAGAIAVYVTNPTDVVLDINGYLAP